MAQQNTIRRSWKSDDFWWSNRAKSEEHLSDIFSRIPFRKIIILKSSDGGRRLNEQSMCLGCKEKVSLTPLYYLDTLENPDTCLSILPNVHQGHTWLSWFHSSCCFATWLKGPVEYSVRTTSWPGKKRKFSNLWRWEMSWLWSSSYDMTNYRN